MSADYRDDVIAALADSEAALLVERDAYRLVAVQAIHALCDRRQQLDRLREQHHRLLDERRVARIQREAA